MVFCQMQTSLTSQSASGKASLVCESSAIAPGSRIELGVYLQPAHGWHTYWVNPGDSGGPTSIKLNLPKGWIQGKAEFPTPMRLDLAGVISYGYEKPELVLIPVQLPQQLDQDRYTITGRVSWLTCTSEVCKPADQNLRLTISVGTPADSAKAPLFKQAFASIPIDDKGMVASATKEQTGIQLSASSLPKDLVGKEVYFFPSKTGLVDHSKPETVSWKGANLHVFLPNSPYAQKKPTRLMGVLAFTESRGAKLDKSFSINIPIAP